MNAPRSFLSAMIDFFGLLPDQKQMQFGKEIQALSPENKQYFRDSLEALGYNIS